jgi:hypothetical protein
MASAGPPLTGQRLEGRLQMEGLPFVVSRASTYRLAHGTLYMLRRVIDDSARGFGF